MTSLDICVRKEKRIYNTFDDARTIMNFELRVRFVLSFRSGQVTLVKKICERNEIYLVK